MSSGNAMQIGSMTRACGERRRQGNPEDTERVVSVPHDEEAITCPRSWRHNPTSRSSARELRSSKSGTTTSIRASLCPNQRPRPLVVPCRNAGQRFQPMR